MADNAVQLQEIPAMSLTIDQMSNHLAIVEKKVSSQAESLQIPNVDQEIEKVTRKLVADIDSRLATLQGEITNTLNMKVSPIESEVKKLADRVKTNSYVSATRTSISQMAPKPQSGFKGNVSSQGNTTPQHQQKKTPRSNIVFNPKRCIVITDITKEEVHKLNQDIIRATINAHFGPTMIDLINRYKFNSNNPKYIVQLAKEDDIDKIVDSWDETLFGGSHARRTIEPQNLPTGMIRGVPIDLEDETLNNDIISQYNNAKLYRLRAPDGSLLRTVKINFATEAELNSAIQKGILLHSRNTLLRVEAPYSSTDGN